MHPKRLSRVVGAAALVGFGFVAPGLFGQTWTSGGPFGGEVTNLSSRTGSPGEIYAGGPFGAFRSNDGGENWTAIRDELPEGVGQVVPDPSHPGVLYAVSGTVLKSVDDGGTWAPANVGLPDGAAVASLHINPANPLQLFCIAETGSFNSRVDRVFTTTDGAAHWTLASTGLPANASVPVLAIDPKTSKVYFADSGSEDVFATTDGGAHWTLAGTVVVGGAFLFGLVVDPENSSTLYVGAGALGEGSAPNPQAAAGSSVFRSDDAGAHWTPAGAGLPGAPRDLAFDSADVLHAATSQGVYTTTDRGASWTPTGTAGLPETDTDAVLPDRETPGTLDVGLPNFGVYRSTDGGATWSSANEGLTGLSTVAIAPANGHLYAIGGKDNLSEVFRSDDRGGHWTDANSSLEGIFVLCLAVDPTNSSIVYAGAAAQGAVYRSTDAGAHWSLVSQMPSSGGLYALAVSPANPSILLAGFFDATYRSTDGGAHWTMVNSAAGFQLLFAPANPQIVYMPAFQAGTFNLEVLRSTDGGVHWSGAGAGLPAASADLSQTLAIDPDDAATLDAEIGGKLFVTHDSGAAWTPLATPFSTSKVLSVAVNPVSGLEIVATTDGSGNADGHLAFESRDGGSTWTSIDAGLAPLFRLTGLAFESDGIHLHSGTDGQSVVDVVLPSPPIPPRKRKIEPVAVPRPAKKVRGRP